MSTCVRGWVPEDTPSLGMSRCAIAPALTSHAEEALFFSPLTQSSSTFPNKERLNRLGRKSLKSQQIPDSPLICLCDKTISLVDIQEDGNMSKDGSSSFNGPYKANTADSLQERFPMRVKLRAWMSRNSSHSATLFVTNRTLPPSEKGKVVWPSEEKVWGPLI